MEFLTLFIGVVCMAVVTRWIMHEIVRHALSLWRTDEAD